MIKFVGQDLFPQFPLVPIEEVVEAMNNSERFGFDIETTRKYEKNKYREDVYAPGLDPKMSKIIMAQVSIPDGDDYVIDCRKVDIRKLKEPLENPNIKVVGQNLQFEYKHLMEVGIRLQGIQDIMIREKILYNGARFSYSLEAMNKRYFGAKSTGQINLFDTPEDNVNKRIRRELDINFFKDQPRDEEDIIEEIYEDFFMSLIDKSTRMQFINWGSKPFLVKQIQYGADDSRLPLKIFDEQEKGRKIVTGVSTEVYYPRKAFILENLVVGVLAEASWRGVDIDANKWLATYEKNKAIYLKRLETLNRYVEDNHLEFCGSIGLFSNRPTCAIEWTSSKQVVKYFKWLNICPKAKSPSTKKMEYTVGAKEMFKKLDGEHKGKFFNQEFPDVIVSEQDLILAYLLFKKSEQLTTTFGKEWLKYKHPITGRVHTNYNQYMISSRLSSTNPNLQQIPGIGDFRGCFRGRFLNCDFSGQELRIAAEVHNVEKMIDFFVNGDPTFGDDFHSFSATQIERVRKKDPEYIVEPKEINGKKNPKFTKEHSKERNDSKSTTFKLNYGGTAYTLSQEFGITVEEAEAYIENYFEGLPGLGESHKKHKDHALKYGWIEIDPWSKKRYFFPDMDLIQETFQKAQSLKPDNWSSLSKAQKESWKDWARKNTDWSKLWSQYWSLIGKLERRGLNIPIQGNAATMTKIAAVKIYNWRWNNGVQDEFWIPLFVHDEIVGCTTNKEREEEFANVISKSMVEAGKVTCPRVPQVAKPVIGDHWQH